MNFSGSELESMRAANARLTAEIARLEADLLRLRVERATNLADADRVVEWIRYGTKGAVISFTEGAERQIAYAVEDDRRRRLGDALIHPLQK